MSKKLKILIGLVVAIVIIIIIALLFIYYYPGIGRIPNKKMRESYSSKTSLYYDNKFHNISDVSVMTGKWEENKSAITKPEEDIPVVKWNEYPSATEEEFTINWLGHSSMLIQMGGKNILIDPVLSTYASPVSFTGSKRFSDIPIEKENIPEIDVLLISHDHYDHLDYRTIKEIDYKVKKYIVPLGVESYLLSWGIDEDKIYSLAWWDDVEIDGISYTSTPAQHYSGRNPLEKDVTWWSGYYFSDNNNSVYYTGDSGYTSSFKEINERLGEVDVLLADSGQYNEAWSSIHMNPKEALQTALDVNAKYYIPVHWGTFSLSDHDWNAPAKIATENMDEFGVVVITPKIGERVIYQEIENYQEHWFEMD